MVIYDKNQFRFNVIFFLILITGIFLNVYYATNFRIIDKRLSDIEENQVLNYLQGSHNEVDYRLTNAGFLVSSADDFGKFNGPSMQPSIFDGNILIEKRYLGEELSEGQIVRFLRDDGYAVIHRIRANYGDKYYIQGDSLKDGEIVEKNKITHVVVGVLFT